MTHTVKWELQERNIRNTRKQRMKIINFPTRPTKQNTTVTLIPASKLCFRYSLWSKAECFTWRTRLSATMLQWMNGLLDFYENWCRNSLQKFVYEGWVLQKPAHISHILLKGINVQPPYFQHFFVQFESNSVNGISTWRCSAFLSFNKISTQKAVLFWWAWTQLHLCNIILSISPSPPTTPPHPTQLHHHSSLGQVVLTFL